MTGSISVVLAGVTMSLIPVVIVVYRSANAISSKAS